MCVKETVPKKKRKKSKSNAKKRSRVGAAESALGPSLSDTEPVATTVRTKTKTCPYVFSPNTVIGSGVCACACTCGKKTAPKKKRKKSISNAGPRRQVKRSTVGLKITKRQA